MPARIGTAGWSLPRAEQEHFSGDGRHLERYAARFPVVEINSSFHRSHRAATWMRWRDSVPESFRFSVKMPKAITHTQKLLGTDELIDAFLGEAGRGAVSRPLEQREQISDRTDVVPIPDLIDLDEGRLR